LTSNENEIKFFLLLLLNNFIFRIKPFIPTSNECLLELDRNGRKFELCIERGEPILNVKDLTEFLPCTCNLDPYLNKLIRGKQIVSFIGKKRFYFIVKIDSAAYFLMNNTDENGFVTSDASRFFAQRDST